VLKQAKLGMPVADLIRRVGISEQTFYRSKKQYAGLQSDQVRELKQLQDEACSTTSSIKDPRHDLRSRVRELAQARVRYGYRRLHVLLRRDGAYLAGEVVLSPHPRAHAPA
jgi:hypothetical protein